jgi:hypothetical protein
MKKINVIMFAGALALITASSCNQSNNEDTKVGNKALNEDTKSVPTEKNEVKKNTRICDNCGEEFDEKNGWCWMDGVGQWSYGHASKVSNGKYCSKRCAKEGK